MPVVIIPSLLRSLTSGQGEVTVRGQNLREVVDSLEADYPGIRARLCDGDRIQPSLSFAVDGEITQIGLLQPVSENSTVQILPALSGGSRRCSFSPGSVDGGDPA